MEEDTEYTKLPVEDRCVHKVSYLFMWSIPHTEKCFFIAVFAFVDSYGRLDCMDMKNVQRHFD